MQIRTNGSRSELGCWFGVYHQAGKAAVACGCDWSGLACMMLCHGISKLPSPEGRAEGDISVRQLADRGMAVFRADLSDESAAAVSEKRTPGSDFRVETVCG